VRTATVNLRKNMLVFLDPGRDHDLTLWRIGEIEMIPEGLRIGLAKPVISEHEYQFPPILRANMTILIDPGAFGGVMMRKLVGVHRCSKREVRLVLAELKGYPSERRWAKSKRPEHCDK
jgi:hypothetical protein